MSDRFFITRIKTKANHAGSKAVNDTDLIMEKAGYKKLDIYPSRSGNKLVRKVVNASSLTKLSKISSGSLVVVEHPMYISSRYIDKLVKIKEEKGIKLAFVIHDFETIRNLFPDDKEIRSIEKTVLKNADILIVHNEKMKKVFVDRFGFDGDKIVCLGIFDYLCDGEIDRKAPSEDIITVAGNLNSTKSGYIYRLREEKGLRFCLYGVNYEASDNEENTTYKGSVDSDLLPNVIEGKYGLVWDGNSIDSCEGNTGDYMRINNPHKTSLYIASGLPVIVWKEAAVADFVESNGLGFSVSSLSEIKDKAAAISDEEYGTMLKNTIAMGQKLRSGEFFKKALEETERKAGSR